MPDALTHPYPVGLRVRNYGQQYPEARQGTATIVEVVGPRTIQGDTLYEYVVQVDAKHSHTHRTRLMEWSSEATVPGVFDDGFAHDIEADAGPGPQLLTCSCGFTGAETLGQQHARAYGMCGSCWGGGEAFDYFSDCGIGTCQSCGGSGTKADEDRMAEVYAAAEAEIEQAEAEQAAAEAQAEAMLAQYDDDPNPYHGTYSEA